ncbi:ultraviolet-B receptor UVR8 isoform X2 [Cucumis melo var. makuwa]|uniref:Ultraviolet-B receptor UVR8 isoform X2 n=1 Tax=Cucumis melo var. makuwa TaxID=1194695 RepID=A0A5D3CWB1_CUCMM|nr:ultraviolet-B receptor UVR8 isoform X2 [Cucumis melo var. makuwa]
MNDPQLKEDDVEQEMWSWGAGTDGQLGTGRLEDNHLPQLVRTPSLSSVPAISFLSCGGAHVIALTAGGGVLTWGRGNSGQLGLGDMISSLHPKPVMRLGSYIITQVSAGWSHSGFVSDEGKLYTCGDGSFGQLGHGDYHLRCFPDEVLFFSDKHVDQIACGMRHSLALVKGCSGEQVYGFGAGKRGQLGISKKIQTVNLPILSSELEAAEIVGIAAGGDHSAALSTEGHLYTWGRGFKSNSDVYSPQHLPSPSSFSKVALGWNHALVLTDEGELYMLGGKHHGALSDSEMLNAMKFLPGDFKEDNFQAIPALSGIKVLDIAAGAEHSVIVTGMDGGVKTWGWGEHGQLGLGDTCDHTNPQTVNLNLKLESTAYDVKVYCGSGFTVAVATSNLRN